jgi:6-pyruvoyltetrahydropterin/6-carboxytetrahydropterin synthase
MIIRKQFQFNGMHIVRDCSSDRCKKSIHSHTYKVEIKVKSQYLDNAGMVLDFGLMKGHIKDIISSFDNAYSLWTKEKNDYKQLVTINNDRWIEMPCSPTAEQYAVMFYAIINEIFNKFI